MRTGRDATGELVWLSTFDYALIQVSKTNEIPFHNGTSARIGSAFITRAESGEPWSGSDGQLDYLVNPQDLSRLVAFDTWTLNCDRHSWPGGGDAQRARINRNNVFLSEEASVGRFLLKAMDHTHCFTCGRELSRKLSDLDKIRDPRVFGLFPEFQRYMDRTELKKAAFDLRRINRTDVVRMTGGIPSDWEVDPRELDALRDLVMGRAAFVADTIESKIWPDCGFDFSNPGETGQ